MKPPFQFDVIDWAILQFLPEKKGKKGDRGVEVDFLAGQLLWDGHRMGKSYAAFLSIVIMKLSAMENADLVICDEASWQQPFLYSRKRKCREILNEHPTL